jgi:hypothetical protein
MREGIGRGEVNDDHEQLPMPQGQVAVDVLVLIAEVLQSHGPARSGEQEREQRKPSDAAEAPP